MEEKKSIIDEIFNMKLDTQSFNILGEIEGNKFNLIIFLDKYQCFYLDEKDNRSFCKEFTSLDDAKRYIIDLYTMFNNQKPIYKNLNDEVLFNQEKAEVIKMIKEEDNINQLLAKLILKIRNIKFSDSISSFTEINEFLISNQFQIPQKIIENVLLFTNPRKNSLKV